MPPLLLLAGALAARALGADSTAPSVVIAPAGSPATPVAPVSTPPRARPISSDLATTLNSLAPAYTEQATKPLAATPAPAADKPRNTIYRVPEFRQAAPKAKPPSPYTFLSPQGTLDLAYKRRPGLRFGSLPIPFFSNDGIALMMLEEDRRIERMKELDSMVGLMREADPATYERTKEAVYDAKVRSR